MALFRGFLVCGIVFLWLGSSTAQSFKGRNLAVPVVQQSVFSADTLRILAVMCEFQSDNDATTVGPGKFDSIYTQDYGTSILDPLPHDSTHFASHLEFAANYFRKVSGGKVAIKSTLLPLRLSVSKTMRNYSPPINSTDFKPVADFAKEAWVIADSAYNGIQPAAYDLFIVFHAGVGRDVSLPGSLGNERDIPSIYMNLAAFRKYLGASFTGIQVRNGVVTNTLVLPQTENREVSSFGSKSLYQITINGLLVSGIASHLGLPDLFNTETGLSAIGKFGLMDGQAIFAYNGLFPPEPSAWEKIYLGWATPVTLTTGGVKKLVTRIKASPADAVIYKVPITNDEYYLVENRRRDAINSGAVVTSKIRGRSVVKVFQKDTTGFYPYAVDSVDGVVIDVDEFDWALPGSGIVIWHIDENVIRQKLAANSVNTDKTRRGVDVEEADGVQDIGEQFTTVFGDVLTGEGTYQDLWYAGNGAKLYKNEFSAASRPATISNTGSQSLISFTGFSAPADTMSFTLNFGSGSVFPVRRSPLAVANVSALAYGMAGDSTYFVLRSADSLIMVNYAGNNVLVIPGFSSAYPSVASLPAALVAAGLKDSLLNLAVVSPAGIPALQSRNIGGMGYGMPVVVKSGSGISVYAGTSAGKVVRFVSSSAVLPAVPEVFPAPAAHQVLKIVADSTYAAWAVGQAGMLAKPMHAGEFYLCDASGVIANISGEFKDAVLSVNGAGERYIAVLTHDALLVYKNRVFYSRFTGNQVIAAVRLSLGDIAADGNNYLLLSSGTTVAAYNFSGALAVGFPAGPQIADSSAGFPVYAADADNNGTSELFGFTASGTVYQIPSAGASLPVFSFVAGNPMIAAPVIYRSGARLLLAGVSAGELVIWNLSNAAGAVSWGGNYGLPGNGSSVPSASSAMLSVKNAAPFKPYNYPNPAYGGITWFRGFAPAAAKITVDIFDLAGDRVEALTAEVSAGMDFEIPWNLSRVQSGVYLATVSASGGFSGTAVVKVAVIK